MFDIFFHDFSSIGSYLWLWWFDFFISYDIYIGFCSYISEIWFKEVCMLLNIMFSWDLFLLYPTNVLFRKLWIIKIRGSCVLKCIQILFYCLILPYWYRLVKQMAWLIAVTQSLLIVASRKHYSVDVVVAW